MCDFCELPKWKNIRMALAAEAIGNFSVHAKSDDSPAGVEPFLEAVVEKFVKKIQRIAPSVPCDQLSTRLVAGITRAWPKLTLEEKFDMALKSGAIRL